MERLEIKELLKEVLGPNVPLVDHTKWVSLCCPFDKRPNTSYPKVFDRKR